MIPGVPTAEGALDAATPILRVVATVLMAFLGMLSFGMIGSLAYPIGGVGAILGSIIGLILFGAISFCATGLYKEFLPKDAQKYGIASLLPGKIAALIGDHGNFTLILTVHEAKGVQVKAFLPWVKADMYVEIEAGLNPMKRTCVNADGKFNEQFKLQIRALDESILLRVKDQDLFGSADIGYVCLNIQQDIIKRGFGWRQEFVIEAFENDRLAFGGRDRAVLVLSFDTQNANDFPGIKDPAATAARAQESQALDNEWNADYGAVSFLSKIEFDTKYKMPLQAVND